MANFAPLLIGYGSSMVMTIGSFQKLVTIVATCISENFLKIVIGTSTSLP
jgi:hypothetical protein